MATSSRRQGRVPVIHREKPAGTAPGTLLVDPHAPRPVLRAIAYGPEGQQEAPVARPEELDAYRGRWPVVWINVDGLGDTEILQALARMFTIHRLALEDVVNVHQRAKVEPYEDHLFVVARMVHMHPQLGTEQISMFVGRDYVLTFQERAGDCFDLVRQRIQSGRGRIRHAGAGYLAYALLDALVDAYFPVLEVYGERIEALEDAVLANPDTQVAARIHAVKRDLLVLRRAIWPHREAVNALLREQPSYLSAEAQVHLRDCYDHTIQLLDIVETYRELASGLLDVYLSSVGNRMNEIMKILTIFAAIFIPLTFVAGLYGMNFEHMPEVHWVWAYPAVLAIMAAIGAGMLVFFRHKGWIGRRS